VGLTTATDHCAVLIKEEEQSICEVAASTAEACKLIEVGFTYVTGEYDDGSKIFRKPK